MSCCFYFKTNPKTKFAISEKNKLNKYPATSIATIIDSGLYSSSVAKDLRRGNIARSMCIPSNGGIGIKLKSPSPRFTTAILMKRPLYSLRKFDLINIMYDLKSLSFQIRDLV